MAELTKQDLETLKKRGITPERVEEQLEMLRKGFPYLKIEAPAKLGHGIFKADSKMEFSCVRIWERYLLKGGKVTKMVPASGAASRMFKNLFEFLNGSKDKPDNDFMRKFFNRIEDFAFYTTLNRTVMKLHGKSLHSMIKEGKYKEIVAALLGAEGMNYGALPKGLLEFHKVMGGTRTPLEEHLAEGAQYACGSDDICHVHFTVSEEHLPLMKAKVEESRGLLTHLYGKEYDITFSIQKPSTDTVAALKSGEPYREDGELFFRPGGHGALIENLGDLDADIIFIKNIDNVVPDDRRISTILNKKVIAGALVAIKQRADEYCAALKKGEYTESDLKKMLEFMREVLWITHDKADEMTMEEKADYIYSKLNRPVRVCGMVRNEGEPGGGPFLVYNPDGTVSPQILESSQINPADKEAKKMLEESTHFNPVDLVCAIKDWEGKPFNLTDYVDKATGFISEKSRKGVEFHALELPGLWNGAMSDWNTVLIEVPAETFNPVKTVVDLLRESHQPS